MNNTNDKNIFLVVKFSFILWIFYQTKVNICSVKHCKNNYLKTISSTTKNNTLKSSNGTILRMLLLKSRLNA